MKRVVHFITMTLCLFLGGSTVWARDYMHFNPVDPDTYILRGDIARKSGDYTKAKGNYLAVVLDDAADRYNRKKAFFGVAYCDIRTNNPYSAIYYLNEFLKNFGDGGSFLIPDTLYVLGRTCEAVGSAPVAKDRYRECIQRFSTGEFPRKSQQRLDFLAAQDGNGEGGNDSGHGHLSGNDPFDGGFEIDPRKNKLDQLREKFKQLHEQP